MALPRSSAKGLGRFDSDHFVTLFGKPGSITARSGSYVENQKLRAREKGKPVGVEVFGFDLLVSLEKVVCVTFIDRHF